MGQPKQSEERPNASLRHQVSIDEYICTRDSVVRGLATLQTAIQDLSRVYIAHTNSVITTGSGSPPELWNLQNPFRGENAFFGVPSGTPGPVQEIVESKKRKRVPHDKNAPKRPVTPYFLYMQTARSEIASEMDSSHTAKEVAEEGTRRWNVMAPKERNHWSYKYKVNFARYKEKVKAYKAGRPIPEISDAQAEKLYEEAQKAGLMEGFEEIEDDVEMESSISISSKEDSVEPPKAPSPPKSPRTSKRRKSGKDLDVTRPSLAPPIQTKEEDFGSVESVNRVVGSEKKKRSTRNREVNDADDQASLKDIPEIDATPSKPSQDIHAKSKKSRRKRKSEIIDE